VTYLCRGDSPALILGFENPAIACWAAGLIAGQSRRLLVSGFLAAEEGANLPPTADLSGIVPA